MDSEESMGGSFAGISESVSIMGRDDDKDDPDATGNEGSSEGGDERRVGVGITISGHTQIEEDVVEGLLFSSLATFSFAYFFLRSNTSGQIGGECEYSE